MVLTQFHFEFEFQHVTFYSTLKKPHQIQVHPLLNSLQILPYQMLKSKQINYNGELDGFHVHKTVEIRAPYGNYVSVTVEDFNIGNKTIEMGGKEDDDLCGYGSIFIFAGQGSINQMIKVVEFCGSKDSPIIDYQNKNYLGIQGKNFSKFLRFR